MPNFMDIEENFLIKRHVDSENQYPAVMQPRFLPETFGRPLSNVLNNSLNRAPLERTGSMTKQWIEPKSSVKLGGYGFSSKDAFSTPTQSRSRFGNPMNIDADASMALASPLGLSRSTITGFAPKNIPSPPAFSPFAPCSSTSRVVDLQNHVSMSPDVKQHFRSRGDDGQSQPALTVFADRPRVQTTPAFTPAKAENIQDTPSSPGFREVWSAETDKKSLWTQDFQRLVMWENKVASFFTLHSVCMLFLLPHAPVSALSILPLIVAIPVLFSQIPASAHSLAPEPLRQTLSNAAFNPSSWRAGLERVQNGFNAVTVAALESVLMAVEGRDALHTVKVLWAVWCLSTLGCFISLQTFLIAALYLTFTAPYVAAKTRDLRDKWSAAVHTFFSGVPVAVRGLFIGLSATGASWISYRALLVLAFVLPTASITAAVVLSSFSVYVISFCIPGSRALHMIGGGAVGPTLLRWVRSVQSPLKNTTWKR